MACICHVRKRQSAEELICGLLGGLRLSLISGLDSFLTKVGAA